MSFMHGYLLAGLLLVGVPILVHLIMRQKPKQLPFPAFRFLRQTHLINRRKLRLQHWLLMLLRMLLVAVVVLALCRPRLAGELFPRSFRSWLGAGADWPVAAVFVFDTSYSMEYREQSQSRLDLARLRALALYREMADGSRIAVLETGEEDTEEEWTVTPSQVRGRITNLRLRPVVAPLALQIERARGKLLQAAREENAPRPLLYVFSDRTRTSWDGELLKDFHKDDDKTNPITVAFVDVGVEKPEDVAIESIKLEPPSVQPGQLITVSVVVRATGMAYNQYLACQLDGDVDPQFQKVKVDLEPGQSKLVSFKVSAPSRGQSTQANAPYQAFGQVSVRLLGRGDKPFDDALAFNNSASATFLVRDDTRREGRKVLTLVDASAYYTITDNVLSALKVDPKVKVPEAILPKLNPLKDKPYEREPFLAELTRLLGKNDKDLYADKILESAEISPHRIWEVAFKARKAKNTGKGFDCKVMTLAEAEKLTAKELEAYRVVCLFQTLNPKPIVWDKLKTYVRGGGGLIIVPGGEEMEDKKVRDAFNNPEPDFGLLPARLVKLITLPIGHGVPWSGYDSTHPLLLPFKEWSRGAAPDFDSHPPFVNRYWLVEPVEKEGVIVTYATSVTVDGRTIDRPPALVEKSLDRGRIVMFTVPLDYRRFGPDERPWHIYWDTSFGLVLINELAGYLAGDVNAGEYNFHAGQAVTAPLPPEVQAGATLRLDSPDPDLSDSERTVQVPGELGEFPSVVLPQATYPGNYRLLDLRNQRVSAFSVVVRPEESELARVELKEIEEVLGKGSVLPGTSDLTLSDTMQSNKPPPIELLPLLMILTLLALAVEGSLANRFYRAEQPAANDAAQRSPA